MSGSVAMSRGTERYMRYHECAVLIASEQKNTLRGAATVLPYSVYDITGFVAKM